MDFAEFLVELQILDDCSSGALLGKSCLAPLSGDLKSFFIEVSFKLFDHNLVFFESFFQLPLLFNELRQFGLATLSCVWDCRVVFAFGVEPLVRLWLL